MITFRMLNEFRVKSALAPKDWVKSKRGPASIGRMVPTPLHTLCQTGLKAS